ncbi:hypothetical protein [Enterovibrio coralii]|uniref:Uncharacterized protein n=1 Tax=Enterovibrio coralii TaxID=294935 RepID=A0A135ICK5_9GAMM|nr:hypothetical protein [Enterovibrio coralii]KXF83074.1 hypothetical protein ATN88_04960 [Enterovibrio coralii]
MGEWLNKEVAGFDIAVMTKRTVGNLGKEYESSGKGKEWHSSRTVRLEGFNDFRVISLDTIWQQMLENKETQFSGVVLALETIVKLGDTLQLETPYDVEINITY